jgi:hypothetical protein
VWCQRALRAAEVRAIPDELTPSIMMRHGREAAIFPRFSLV